MYIPTSSKREIYTTILSRIQAATSYNFKRGDSSDERKGLKNPRNQMILASVLVVGFMAFCIGMSMVGTTRVNRKAHEIEMEKQKKKREARARERADEVENGAKAEEAGGRYGRRVED